MTETTETSESPGEPDETNANEDPLSSYPGWVNELVHASNGLLASMDRCEHDYRIPHGAHDCAVQQAYKRAEAALSNVPAG